MKHIIKLSILAALFLSSGCSSNNDVTIPFKDHAGNTYIIERDQLSQNAFEKVYEIFEFDKDEVIVTEHQGFELHDKAYQYTDAKEDNIYKRKFKPLDYFTAIPNSIYFMKTQDDGDTIKATTVIYWFTQTSIFFQELENIMEEGRETYDRKDVWERLQDTKMTEARVESQHSKKVKNKAEVADKISELQASEILKKEPRIGDWVVGEYFNIKVEGVGSWQKFNDNAAEYRGREYANLNIALTRKNDIDVLYDSQFEIKDHMGMKIPGLGHYDEASHIFTKLEHDQTLKTTIPVMYRGDGTYTITINNQVIPFIIER